MVCLVIAILIIVILFSDRLIFRYIYPDSHLRKVLVVWSVLPLMLFFIIALIYYIIH